MRSAAHMDEQIFFHKKTARKLLAKSSELLAQRSDGMSLSSCNQKWKLNHFCQHDMHSYIKMSQDHTLAHTKLVSNGSFPKMQN